MQAIELKKLLDVLKDVSALLVGAAAFLYVLGYTVHLAYFRVLGIQTVDQPLDYVRLAADYVASIIASVPLLLLDGTYYLPTLIRPPFLTAAIFCLGMVLAFILFHARERLEKYFGKAERMRHVSFVALNITTVVALALLLRLEFDIAKVRHVLQTVDSADVQQMQNQLANPEVQKWDNKRLFDLKKKNINRVYSKYMAAHRDTPGFYYWSQWFDPITSPGNATIRSTLYLALLFVNLAVLISAVWQLVWLSRSRDSDANRRVTSLNGYWRLLITTALAFGILTQLFIFPYMYATLGRTFVYPVVRLKLAGVVSPNSESAAISSGGSGSNKSSNSTVDMWTHGVYLLSESDTELVVYDRLNFFQIKHVPKTRVLTMSQLFNASPFELCDTQQMTPCETLWIPEDTSVLDF